MKKTQRKNEQPVHDRRSNDLPLNARVAVSQIVDPFGIADIAIRAPKRRADGSDATGEQEWVAPGPPKIVVIRSLRDDPLGRLYARESIDEVQFNAGRHWQILYERASVGAIQSVDTTKEPVDGGQMREVVTDGQMAAIDKLRSAAKKLGESGNWLVTRVLGDGLFINQVAESVGDMGRRKADRWRVFFKKCLEKLAEEFGYARRGQEGQIKVKTRSFVKKEANDNQKEERGVGGIPPA